MDSSLKKEMAISLCKNYCELQKNFVLDSHHHDVSVSVHCLSCITGIMVCFSFAQASNMTVQIFTTPSLVSLPPACLPAVLTGNCSLQSRMLVLEHGLLSVMLKTLQDLLSPSKDSSTGCLKLRPNNYKHSRIFYMVYDLRYCRNFTICALWF